MSFERLERLLKELKEDERPKLVEGMKDKKALQYFGVTNIKLIHGKPLQEAASKIEKEVILLTDYDRKGSILTKRLSELFQSEGVHVDLSYRRDLRKLAKIRQVEELVTKYEQLHMEHRGEIHGKDLHRYSKVCSPRRD